jgi:hypothetical protein
MFFWPSRKLAPVTLAVALERLKGRDKSLHRDVADSVKRHRRVADPEKTFATEPRYARFWAGGNYNSDDELMDIFARELARIFGDDIHPDKKPEQRAGSVAVPLRDGRTLLVSAQISRK